MIIRPRPHLLRLFFILRGSVVPRILPHILFFALFAAAVTELHGRFWPDLGFGSVGTAPIALLGVALSIYLGFRNNAAYDRWWEARKLWGQLVLETRNLARAADALVADERERRAMLGDFLGFCHFLRGALRRVDALPEALRFSPDAARFATEPNRADAALHAVNRRLGALRRAGALDPIAHRILDEHVSACGALQAGCERISGTPLPFAYTLLLQRTAVLFCLLLPFGLAGAVGWATPALTAIVAYTFFGLDALSEELEDPFGIEPNDLALDALCRTCEISVAQALGDPPPPPMAPDRFRYT